MFIQFGFTSFSPKIIWLTDLDNNYKYTFLLHEFSFWLGEFLCKSFCISLIFNFLKIFVFWLSMQVLRAVGAGMTIAPRFFPLYAKKYAFISIKWSFCSFCPLTLKFKIRFEKTQVSTIFKNYEKKGGTLYIIQQQTNFSKLMYSFKYSAKAFNHNKTGLFDSSFII